YIDRRMRAARFGVEAPEELDYLGHYLSRGLYFDDISDDVYQIFLTSHTEAIDDYYHHQSGTRKTPAPMPARLVDPIVGELIHKLEATAPPNFAEAVFWLLELGSNAQTTVGEMIESRRKRARDGLLTAVRSFMGNMVFVYMATPNDDLRPLEKYLTAVKYAGQTDLAVGIAQSVVDPSNLAVDVQYAERVEDSEAGRSATEILKL